MSSTRSTAPSTRPWTSWQRDAKLRLLARLRAEVWQETARPEQLPPAGDWSVWYLRGGRGAGKSRTGAETLANWINENDPGEWMLVAPTFADAKRCVEQRGSGLIEALGGLGVGVKNWNRSEGVLYTANGSEVYLDGADDGALRVQGHNLRGAWCDEVGLWRDWERSWNESLQQALRLEPGRIVATGTPKMGHPLVAHLLRSAHVAVTHMRTLDNIDNLNPRRVAELYEEYGGTTLGRQELEGEFIEAIEGALLSRHDWVFFPADWHVEGQLGRLADGCGRTLAAQHGRFEKIVHSWDTTWKAKVTSDYVAGQVWGVRGPDRFLVGVYHAHASLEQTVAAMLELRSWSQQEWPTVAQYVIIENAAWGPEAADEIAKRVDGVHRIRAKGDKLARALAASPALETGRCHLPGVKDDDPNGRGYGGATPALVQSFVEECALFLSDMKHAHDDQVDAWSQMVNWTRMRGRTRATLGVGSAEVARAGRLAGSSARSGTG